MITNDAGGSDFLNNAFPAEVWHKGTRYESADRALITVLSDEGIDKSKVLRDVLREKFTQNPDLGEQLIQASEQTVENATVGPDHDLWTTEDVQDALLDVREELAGREVMRTGMILATHASLVLMGRDSDLGDDLLDSALRAGLETKVPTDSPSLSAFEEAMANAIAHKWGDIPVKLFELGKTILLYLSMEGITDDDPEYEQAYVETRKVLQESADLLEMSEKLWTILDEHGSDPEQINPILQKVVRAAFGRSER